MSKNLRKHGLNLSLPLCFSSSRAERNATTGQIGNPARNGK